MLRRLPSYFILSLFYLSAQTGALVFMREGNVWITDTEGTPGSLRQLTTGGGASQPRLAAGVVTFMRSGQLYRTNTSGATPVLIPNTAGILEYDQSPNADRIVLTYSANLNRDLYVMTIDGQNKTLVSSNSMHKGYPFWGRNGYIYFGQAQVGNALSQAIYRLRESTTGQPELIIPGFSQFPVEGGPASAPRLIYLVGYPTKRIQRSNLDGTSPADIQAGPTGEFNRMGFDYYSDVIYYLSGNDIWRMNGNGSNRRIIATGASPGELDYGVTSSTLIAPGLVSWYRFDEPTDLGRDSQGTNHGTPSNVSATTGIVGGAASFTQGFIQLPQSASLNLRGGDFTLSAFVKGTATSNRNWLSKATITTAQYGLGGAGTVSFGFDGVASSNSGQSKSSLFDGKWHHVAGVKRGGQAEIWVDGVLESSSTISNLTTTESGRFAIGRNGECCEYFDGAMDEVRIYNIPLSPTQISTQAGALGQLSNRLYSNFSSVYLQYQVGIPVSTVAKSIDIYSTGAPVPLSASVSATGNSFVASLNRATSPAKLTISALTNLLPGNYSGEVTISSSGLSQLRIPVSLVVSSDPKLSEVPVPDTTFLISLNGAILPDRDTIVLTHGLNTDTQVIQDLWTGSGTNRASALLPAALSRSDVNILQFVWTSSFVDSYTGGPNFVQGLQPTCSEYKEARSNAFPAGDRLASDLEKALGRAYDKKIQFLGHSLGTVVNARAAAIFLKRVPNVAEAQFTALDRPDRITTIYGCTDTDETQFGFHPNFFYNALKDVVGTKLVLDNYYAELEFKAAGVGDVANGGFFNHKLVDPGKLNYIFNEAWVPNDHSGVHQWYRWSMNPTIPLSGGSAACDGGKLSQAAKNWFLVNVGRTLDDSLAPCENGWSYSILNPARKRFSAESQKPYADDTNFPPLSTKKNGGCAVTQFSPVKIECIEASSPYFVFNVDVPALANSIAFDLKRITAGDGDFISLVLDNDLIWKVAGDSLPLGEFVNSGPIPIQGVAPGLHQLTIGLHGQGSKNFSFSLENLTVAKRSTDATPTVVPAPLVNSGAAQTYTFQFSDVDGYRDLGVVNVLINNYLDGRQACYIAYDRPNNVLYLVNDAGDAINGMVLNGTGSLANKQCTILGAGSTASGSGNILTLTLNIQFSQTNFPGAKVIYLASRDRQENNSGWQTMGVQAVPGSLLSFPNSVSATPPSGTTPTAVLSFAFDDQTNADNLQTAWALVNTSIDGRQACYVAYYRPANTLYLYPDNGDGSQATSIVLTGTNTIENSQCKISAAGSTVTKSGARLTVSLNTTFKPAFKGPKGIWSAVQTMGGAKTSDWKAVGAWQVPP